MLVITPPAQLVNAAAIGQGVAPSPVELCAAMSSSLIVTVPSTLPVSRVALLPPHGDHRVGLLAAGDYRGRIRPAGTGGGGPSRHRHARRAGAAAGLHALPYANPDAPKGGRLVQGVLGTFDSLNPFIVKGLPAQGLRAPLVAAATSSAAMWSRA